MRKHIIIEPILLEIGINSATAAQQEEVQKLVIQGFTECENQIRTQAEAIAQEWGNITPEEMPEMHALAQLYGIEKACEFWNGMAGRIESIYIEVGADAVMPILQRLAKAPNSIANQPGFRKRIEKAFG